MTAPSAGSARPSGDPTAAARPVGAQRPLSRWMQVGRLRLHARTMALAPAGAPALVLVHGAGVSSRYMTPVLARLAPWFRVWAPDLPGFGRSSKPPRTLDLDELADALVAWMDAAGIARATLLGNSVGCQVIVTAALRHPGRVERLVLTGPTMDPSAPSLWRQGLRWAATGLTEPLSLFPLLILDYFQSGIRRFVRTVVHGLRDPMREKLSRVQVPTLVVRGGRDRIVTQRWAEEVAALLPQGRLSVIRRGGHALNFDAPRALARLVRAFAPRD